MKDCGVTVICSHHDFEKTPERGVLQMILEKCTMAVPIS